MTGYVLRSRTGGAIRVLDPAHDHQGRLVFKHEDQPIQPQQPTTQNRAWSSWSTHTPREYHVAKVPYCNHQFSMRENFQKCHWRTDTFSLRRPGSRSGSSPPPLPHPRQPSELMRGFTRRLKDKVQDVDFFGCLGGVAEVGGGKARQAEAGRGWTPKLRRRGSRFYETPSRALLQGWVCVGRVQRYIRERRFVLQVPLPPVSCEPARMGQRSFVCCDTSHGGRPLPAEIPRRGEGSLVYA